MKNTLKDIWWLAILPFLLTIGTIFAIIAIAYLIMEWGGML